MRAWLNRLAAGLLLVALLHAAALASPALAARGQAGVGIMGQSGPMRGW